MSPTELAVIAFGLTCFVFGVAVGTLLCRYGDK